ncbi:autotransporter outer membrane beta-barrel domain-containing protein [Wohlfahrtiimonas chitiniclastica]|uniref:autotransporter outer membrane beta-barrel domain-containing protein n=3 Tax=Wohlfahrtiimonas chitiniclastica TaxID=400946 RepID=UPI001BCFB21F|nr:autotransporter outer membrane beta-barrel domain-containing protein [Wohlfahrtiimonas chitiniclastica]MBS7815812.1 autotransporter outer membrane beta-barrel domain-containing protein [Wohlfahrtiimonas chitiniclastica]
MNNIFKVVWNQSLNMLVVASEYAKHSGGMGSSVVTEGTRTFKRTKIAASILLLLSTALGGAQADSLKDLLNNGQDSGTSEKRAFYYTTESILTKDKTYTLNFSSSDPDEKEIKWINNGGKAETTSWTIDNSKLLVNGRFYTGYDNSGVTPENPATYYTKIINNSDVTFKEWIYVGPTSQLPNGAQYIVQIDNSQLSGQYLYVGSNGGIEVSNGSVFNVWSTDIFTNNYISVDSPRDQKGYIKITNGGVFNNGYGEITKESSDNLRLITDGTGFYNLSGVMKAYTSNPDFNAKFTVGIQSGQNASATVNLYKLDAFGSEKMYLTNSKAVVQTFADGRFLNTLIGNGNLYIKANNSFEHAQPDFIGPVTITSGHSALVSVNKGLGTNNDLYNLENATLTFVDGTVTELNSNLIGAGTINVGKNNIKVTGNHSSLNGLVVVGSEDSTWNLQKLYNYDFRYRLQGTGNVNISAGNQNQMITFKNETKNQDFTGKFTVERGILKLDSLSENALGNAYLGILPNGTGRVDDNVSVGSLGLQNAKLHVLNNGTAFNLLTAKNGITLTGKNTIVIDNANLLGQQSAIDQMKPTGTLLDQQNQVTLGETFAAGKTSGDRDDVTLVANSGDINAMNIKKDIVGQEAKGQGVYGYQKVVADDTGLHAGYGLKALSANDNQSVTIDSTGASEQKLFVQLTGKGGFTFTGEPLVTVTGPTNDYEGATALTNDAKVALGVDQALGQKGVLTLSDQAQLDLGTHTQSMAGVTASNHTQLNLNAGTLNLTGNQIHEMDGQLNGTNQSALNVQQGTLKVGASNGELATNVTLGNKVTADLAKADGLGKGNVTLQGGNIVNVNGGGTLANALTGDNTNTLALNTGDVTLKGDNSQFAGKISIEKPASANVTAMNNLGTGALEIEGKLNFADGIKGDLNNGITGAGQITLTDNQINVKGEHSGFTGTLTTGDEATWNVSSDAPYDVNYALSGTGTISVDAKGDIALKNVGAKDFTGNFTVKGGNAQLDQTAFDVLNHASLNLTGGAATVTVDGQHVDNLVIHEGTLSLDPKDPNASNHLKVTDTITLIGDKNAIVVDKNTVDKHVTDASAGQVDQTTSFLDQQEGFIGETLVSGKVVTKDNSGNPIDDFEAIFLRDRDGKIIEAKDVGQSTIEIQNGAGEAYYGFNGLRTDDKGIHLNYGLDEIQAYDGKVVTVKSDQSNVTTNSRDLRVELVGQGGFTFTGDQGITLSGNPNTYTGNTIIDDTVITAGMDNVFGQQGDLTLKGQSTFDLAGMKQSVDNLQLGQQGVIDLNQGELTLAQNSASVIEGTLEGNGQSKLNINAGEVRVESSNAGLNATVTLGQNATVNLANTDGLGKGTLAMGQGKNTVNINKGGAFANTLTGDQSNTVNVTQGDVALMADNSGFAGGIQIAQGTGVSATDVKNVGTGVLTVDGELNLANTVKGTLANALTGKGQINLAGSDLTGTGDHDGFTGVMNLDQANWRVVKAQGDQNINYALSGNGTMTVGAAGDIHLNNDTQNQDFTGTFNVQSGHLLLDTKAGYALKEASVNLLPAAKGTVENDLTVGQLSLDNSTLSVTYDPLKNNFNLITATDGIVLTGDNKIEIKDKSLLGHFTAHQNANTDTLLDQQNNITLGELFAAGQTSGHKEGLTLVDAAGDVVSNVNAVKQAIIGQETHGDAFYDYSRLVADDVGIHAGYGLTTLSAHQDQAVIIDSTGTKESNMFVLLTGEGGFTFTGQPAITVSNENNDYTGDSIFNDATVTAGADHVFGDKGALILNGQSTVHLNGHAQTAEALTVSGGSTFALGKGALTLTGDQKNEITGHLTGETGSSVTVEQGSVTVGSSNADLAADISLGKAVNADLTTAEGLGKGQLVLKGGNTVNVNGGGTLANAITGDQTTALNLNQGDTTLTGDNSALSGQITIAKTATANVTAMNNLGSGALGVDGHLTFNDNVNGDLNNGITGAGQITLTDNQINVKGEHSGFTGTLTTGDEATWNVSSDAPYDVNYALSGTGTISVDAKGDIALKNVGAKDFTGNFTVKGGNAQLDQTAFDVLNHASLNLTGGAATVTLDGQHVDNLVIHEGTLSLDPKDPNASNHLKVTDTITLIGDKNAIVVDKNTVDKHVTDASAGQVDQTTSFLDQQEGFIGETLVSGKVVTKDNSGNPIDDFEAIFLRDRDGKIIEAKDVGQSTIEIQNGAGEAYYGFNGLRTDDKGIHLNYGLDEIQAYDGKVVTVKSDQSNVTTNSRDLRVELVGQGGFTFTGDQGITLSGNPNTYTGNTIIDDTVITAGMDNVFGQQGDLTLKGQSTFDLAGMKQSVDALNVDQLSVVDLNGGHLTLTKDQNSTIDGALLGRKDSQLTIDHGKVAINASNGSLDAAVTLNNQSAVTLAKVDGLGQGNVTLNDESALTLKGAGDLNNTIAGKGTLNIAADGVTLHKDNGDFTGTLKVMDQGTANVAALNSLGTATVDVAGTLNINDGVKGDLNNVISGAGTIALGKGSDLNVKGEHGALTGTVTLADQSAWNITTDAPYDLNYALSGTGAVSVDASGAITLKNAGANDFTGEFAVKGGELALDQTGFDVLTNASVSLVGGDASLQLDDQSLKNLTFNQGSMKLQTKDTNDRVNHLNVTGLVTLEGQNNSLRVDPTKLEKTEFDQKVDTSLSFLDQQEGFIGETLIKGQVVKQGDAQIHLADLQGQRVDNDAVAQSAVTIQEGAGQAFYGFNGLRTDDQGIHLNYGLSVIEAYQGQNVAVLSSTTNVTTESRNLSAELIGQGDFTFKGNLGIEVSNGKNSYTGNTVIDGATVTAGADHVFGEKGALNLVNQGQFYLNGYAQTVDQLVIDEGARLELNAGTFTLNDQQTSDIKGALLGDQTATLNIAKGAVNVESINKEFAATVNVDDASVNLNQTQGLGHGQLNLTDKAVVNIAGQGDLLNTIAGSGKINVTPTGQVAVKGQHDAFNGTVSVADQGSWNIQTDAPYDVNYALSGAGTVSVDANGAITLKNVGANDFTGEFAVKGGELALDQTGFSVLDQAHVNLAGGEANLTLDGQTLKNLTFDQGAMTLQKESGGNRSNHLTVSDTITLVGDQNLLKVDQATVEKHGIDADQVDQKTSFLDQQFGMTGETLISGKVVTKDAKGDQVTDYEGIFLADMNGNLIESKDVKQSSAVIQGGAGEAFYGFNGLRTDDKGIHLNYGLDEIEAFKDKNVVVLSDASNTATDSRDLRAELKGEGGFIFKGSEGITLSGNLNTYAGDTMIDGTSITAGMNQVFGTQGNLTIDNKALFDLNGMKQTVDQLNVAAGSALSINGGELTVRQSSTLLGDTMKGNGGTLVIDGAQDMQIRVQGNHDQFGSHTWVKNGYLNIEKDAVYGNGTALVTVDQNAGMGGYGTVKGDVLLKGHLDVGSTVNHQADQPMGNFTVQGNFKAEKGSLIHIASDGELAGRLIITGNAEGESGLKVDDMHGAPLTQLADGTQKVEVVSIGGKTNTMVLTQEGRAVRGAFDYHLEKGSDGNWWLVTAADDASRRPETGVYVGGLNVANTLFNHKLSERNYLSEDSRIWTLVGGQFSQFYDNGKHNRTTIDSYRMMIGGDILRATMDDQPIKVGVFGAYGHSKIKSQQQHNGLNSKGSSDGYGLGLYATFGDQLTQGFYLDGSVQYVYFDNNVTGDQISSEKMKTKGFIASLEGGYTFGLTDQLYLQPQAQVTWMGAKMNDITDSTGTRITGSKNNIETRLGARLFMEKTLDNGNVVTPYMELNYYHNSKPFYASFDGIRVDQHGSRNLGEMKLGIEGQVQKNLSVWGDVGYRAGSNSYHDTKVTLGVRYNF